MKISILGTEYSIVELSTSDDSNLTDKDGYCDTSVKKIVVDNMLSDRIDKDSKANLDAYKNHVKRHELVHAFLYESGLDTSADWAANEEIVDWIAIQFPKIQRAFEAAGCVS